MTEDALITEAHAQDVWRPEKFETLAFDETVTVEGWLYQNGDWGLYNVALHPLINGIQGSPPEESDQYPYALILLEKKIALGAFRSHVSAEEAIELFTPILHAWRSETISLERVIEIQKELAEDLGACCLHVRGELSPYFHLIKETEMTEQEDAP